MFEAGIRFVRIAEFSWVKVEPRSGEYRWDWLDRAIEILGAAGLKVVIGTPTATPPKWLIDSYKSEEILPYDALGIPREFGSRRHYSFSSPVYRNHSARIVELFAQRYGKNPHVAGWQLDNEYGCHDTVRTYDPNAQLQFRMWLKDKYSNDIQKLNQAWGNSFWSMDYGSFDEVDLPKHPVTEANPAHRMDFFRFSSDQVISYNKMQIDIIKKYADPDQFLTTNFMGFFFQFDSFKLGKELDFATWDS